MTMICDAGALVALERNAASMWRRLKAELVRGTPPMTHGAVVAEVWRGGHGRQAPLARALAGIDVTPVDDALGRRAGVLLGGTTADDAIDAAVAALAVDGDRIVTSDPDDIHALVHAARRRVEAIPV